MGAQERRPGDREVRLERFIAGDPLRGIAALWVFTYHAAFFAMGPGAGPASFPDFYGTRIGPTISTGGCSLIVFLVLSGYLISRPFVRSYLTGAPLPPTVRYLRNRVLRIAPAFYAVFAILLLIYGTKGGRLGDFAAVLGFGQSYHFSQVSLLVGQAWTLDVEMGFYLLVPLVAWLLVRALPVPRRPQARLRVVLGLALAGVAASVVFRALTPIDLPWQRSLPSMLAAFMPGIALAAIEIARAQRATPPRPRGAGRDAVLMVAAAVLLLVVYEHVGNRFTFPPRSGTWNLLLATIAAGLIVAAPLQMQWRGAGCSRLLDNRVLHWIGERSFSAYLVHQTIFVEIAYGTTFGGTGRARLIPILALGIPLSLGAAAISYRLFERPFLSAQRRRIAAAGGDSDAVAAPALEADPLPAAAPVG